MWSYDKRLQFPVKIKNPDPQLAKIVISQHGIRTGGSGGASFARSHIERRIPGVVIFCVKVGLDNGKCVAEALKMHDFAFAGT